jgi:hypothetical protein
MKEGIKKAWSTPAVDFSLLTSTLSGTSTQIVETVLYYYS